MSVLCALLVSQLVSAARRTKCQCSDEVLPVCDSKRGLTFPSKCLALCYGAKRSKLTKGFCKPLLQVVERNICPTYSNTTDINNGLNNNSKEQVIQLVVENGKSSVRENEIRQTRRQILQTLVDRLQGSAQRISAIDNRIIRLEKRGSKLATMIQSSVQEHAQRKKLLDEALKGMKIRGADSCPKNFKFQYHVNREAGVAYRKCISAAGSTDTAPVHIEGVLKCPPGQLVRVAREGLVLKRTCVKLNHVGPTSCPPNSNTVLYQHRVGYELRSVCVPKCPMGFRIKVNPTLKGEVARWCIFGPLSCKSGYRKEYQIYKRDTRVLKSVCVPFVKKRISRNKVVASQQAANKTAPAATNPSIVAAATAIKN